MKTRRLPVKSKAEEQRIFNQQTVSLIVDLQARVKALEGYAHVHVTEPEAA